MHRWYIHVYVICIVNTAISSPMLKNSDFKDSDSLLQEWTILHSIKANPVFVNHSHGAICLHQKPGVKYPYPSNTNRPKYSA